MSNLQMNNKNNAVPVACDVEEAVEALLKAGRMEVKEVPLTEEDKKNRVLRFDMVINPR